MKTFGKDETCPVVLMSRYGSPIHVIVKRTAGEHGFLWRELSNPPLTRNAAIILVAPAGDKKVFNELSDKCGIWNEKEQTACACYELEVGNDISASRNQHESDKESLTDWLLTEYYFYGQNEIGFEGADGLSVEQLDEFEAMLECSLQELIKSVIMDKDDMMDISRDVAVSIPSRQGVERIDFFIREAKRIADEALERNNTQPMGLLRSPVAPLESVAALNTKLPNLHAENLSFSARLLTYVRAKCNGVAPMAYKRAGVSRQLYSRIVSSNVSTVDKRTVMRFCIGLQLSIDEACLLMKSAGYAFSDTIPEDMVFEYCIKNNIWNLNDVNEILVKCGLDAIL